MELPCYHGSISKQTGENLLLRNGKNGSYLLRDSESVSGALCLCILFGRLIYTYRIFQNSNGLYKIQTAEGVKEKFFRNLKDLIFSYENPNQGLVHSLTFPVNKESPEQIHFRFKGSLKCRLEPEGTYAEVDERDYVQVLPSPTANK
ncbi:SH2 domain-containing protein 1B-like [Mixophyes fleayi]|uniref:SH2 domain-containing protein 1B-like n=1 Tax=Mixophyes fleayi TaxID=3061075 RepID=UPI003F4D9CDC